MYREAIDRMAIALGDEHWRTALTRANLGIFLFRDSRHDEATAVFERCLEHYCTDRSMRTRRTAPTVITRYRDALKGAGRPEDATEMLRRAHAMMVAAHGPEDELTSAIGALLRESLPRE